MTEAFNRNSLGGISPCFNNPHDGDDKGHNFLFQRY